MPVPTTQAHLDSPAVDEAATAPTTSFRGEEPGVSPDTESSESYVVAESAVDPLVSGASFWTIMLETPRIGVISGLTIALLLMLVLGVLAERDRRLNRRLANAVPTVNESKSDPGPIDGRIWDDPRSS